jgi:hypothetical protein
MIFLRLSDLVVSRSSGWRQPERPSVASGSGVPVADRGRDGGGQDADAGEDLGEKVVAGWQAQGERAGVADQPGGDADQPVPQGGVIAWPWRAPCPSSAPPDAGGR